MKPHRRGAVYIIETGEVFESASACARHLGVNRSAVSNHLRKRSLTVKGRRIAYVLGPIASYYPEDRSGRIYAYVYHRAIHPTEWENDMTARADYAKGLKFLRREHDADIYEVKRVSLKNGAFVTERRVSIYAVSERVVWVSKWVEKERIACFCCTCAIDENGWEVTDSACRNHGYNGRRPCDIHNLPGCEWEDSNEMPESVLTVRKRNEAAHG